jgi:diphthine synthase
MALYLIGLGLCGVKDITVRGLELVKNSDYVFMEYYTSILGVDVEELSKFYEKEIILADREMIENDFEQKILEKAKTQKVSLLVVGDPFSATTHIDLYTRAIQSGVKIEVLNNASIMNSCGITGLSLYRFGETVSIPYFTATWKPCSFLEKIVKNIACDYHTLVLLDIKVKEISEENLCRGKKIYEKPRFMSVNIALEQMLEAESQLNTGKISEDTLVVGVARIGSPTQKIISGKIKDLIKCDFGTPLHSLIVCAPTLHCMEKDMMEFYRTENVEKREAEKI